MELPKTNIEDVIEKLRVKKVLVVDDTQEFIQAAKKAYSDYTTIDFDYASSEQEAKQKILKSYDTGKKYDFILTDMQMEKEDSGKEVLKFALEKLTIGAIITRTFHGAVSSQQEGQKVAAITPLYPFTKEIDPISTGTYYADTFRYDKSQPELWKQALEWSLYRASTEVPREWIRMFNDKYSKIITRQEDVK